MTTTMATPKPTKLNPAPPLNEPQNRFNLTSTLPISSASAPKLGNSKLYQFYGRECKYIKLLIF